MASNSSLFMDANHGLAVRASVSSARVAVEVIGGVDRVPSERVRKRLVDVALFVSVFVSLTLFRPRVVGPDLALVVLFPSDILDGRRIHCVRFFHLF